MKNQALGLPFELRMWLQVLTLFDAQHTSPKQQKLPPKPSKAHMWQQSGSIPLRS